MGNCCECLKNQGNDPDGEKVHILHLDRNGKNNIHAMGQPMQIDDGPELPVSPPKNVNTNPDFVAAKEAQYQSCL